MKSEMKIFLLMPLIFILLFPFLGLLTTFPFPLENNSQNMYILDDPTLTIDGNAQLQAAAFSGNGSKGTPYVIQNKIINASGLEKDGIRIQNTTAYFILKNCTMIVGPSYAGVRIINVTNACLENNHASTSGGTGFAFYSSHYNTVTNNTASNGNTGFLLNYSHNNTLIGNTVSGVTYAGFEFYSSHNNNLTGNTANGNSLGLYGIILSDSNYNTLRWNLLLDYTETCIVNGGYNNVIESNNCGTVKVAGFNWELVILGYFSLILLILAINREKKLNIPSKL